LTGGKKVELLVPEVLLTRFEKIRVELGYPSLSEALRDLMRRFVASNSEPQTEAGKT
jgi:metal-responsive CopG/Arc/MetJ family transcriptional regulator